MATCSHLFIDGYNVLHSWAEGRKAMQRGQDYAIAKLSDYVRVIHDVDGVTTSIVFDGQGTEVQIVRPGEITTFSHIFSPKGLSADAIIEQMVNNAAHPEEMIVVSRDNMVRESINASGAQPMHPDDLFSWIASCDKRHQSHLGEYRRDLEREWREANRPSF